MTTPQIWKPTKAECDAIREAARKELGGSPYKFHWEVGERLSLDDDDKATSINIAALTENRDYEGTDLWQCVEWSRFRKGVELTPAGFAMVDFYVYDRDVGRGHGDLRGNVSIEFENGAMSIVDVILS